MAANRTLAKRMESKMAKVELLYHHAMPGWVKLKGVDIRPIPECEGGGYAVRESVAKSIEDAIETRTALRLAESALSYTRKDGDEFVNAHEACKRILERKAEYRAVTP
jgi:hypothetical protein